MEILRRLKQHFERRFDMGLLKVDPFLTGVEKGRRHLPRAYSIIWLMGMAALVSILLYGDK